MPLVFVFKTLEARDRFAAQVADLRLGGAAIVAVEDLPTVSVETGEVNLLVLLDIARATNGTLLTGG